MTFADKMKELRKIKGKSQEQASNEMGIAISTLRNYENGRLPDTYLLKIIKDYYNVPYEYLLDDECENIEPENVMIGEQLGLSDINIQEIKDIVEDKLSKELNHFLEGIEIYSIIRKLYYIENIDYQIRENLSIVYSLRNLERHIKNATKKVEKKEIENLLKLVQYKLKEFIDFTYSYEKHGIDFVSDSSYEILDEELENIIEIYEDNELEDLESEFIEYEDLCNEIINKMITNEKFYKYEIKQAIDDFLHKKVPNINDINLVYNPEIDIYYKYMENSFPEYILKEIRGIIKNEKISSSIDISNYNILLKKKEGAKNGSNRTNKK